MTRSLMGLVAAALLLTGAGRANAGYIQLTSAGQLSGTDVTATYAGTDGTHFNSPITLAAGGNTLTFSDTASVGFLRADQGNTWTGAFAPGTKLLWGIDANGGNTFGGPVTIGFATGVTEAGLFVQADDSGRTNTFTATVFENGVSKLVITVPVVGAAGAGNLGFIGFQANSGNVITSIVISSVDAGNTAFNNDFAFGPVTFGAAVSNPVPEPSSIALMGLGLASVVAFGRRRLGRSSTRS